MTGDKEMADFIWRNAQHRYNTDAEFHARVHKAVLAARLAERELTLDRHPLRRGAFTAEMAAFVLACDDEAQAWRKSVAW